MNSRPRVALITCPEFPDLYVDDQLLIPALAQLGISAIPVVWSDPGVDWGGLDALVFRSPWDYFQRVPEFRAWLDARMASGVLMCNSREIIEWNFDKKYLQDLAAKGVELVPTLCIKRHEKSDVVALAAARGWNEVVVKPSIAGGAYRTYRFRIEDYTKYADDIAETLKDRGVLVQPFLPEIQTGGEFSLMFFDGIFSHAVHKRAKPGDYRVQFTFGGTCETVEVSAELVEQARACIEHAPNLPVYARVDGVRKDGRFLLMELEAFEPLMYLARHPEAPGRFARAIQGRLRDAGLAGGNG